MRKKIITRKTSQPTGQLTLKFKKLKIYTDPESQQKAPTTNPVSRLTERHPNAQPAARINTPAPDLVTKLKTHVKSLLTNMQSEDWIDDGNLLNNVTDPSTHNLFKPIGYIIYLMGKHNQIRSRFEPSLKNVMSQLIESGDIKNNTMYIYDEAGKFEQTMSGGKLEPLNFDQCTKVFKGYFLH